MQKHLPAHSAFSTKTRNGTPLTIFFLIAALLVIAVLVLLLPVFRRTTEGGLPERSDINASVAKSQAAELKLRLDSGEISQEVYQDEKNRLTATLARDIEKDKRSIGEGKNTGQWMLWPLAAVVPIAAGMLYINLGTPAAIDPASHVAAAVAAPPAGGGQQAPPDMQQIVTRIKQQLELNPEDARGWFMLGRAHLTLGEYQEAEVALRRSLEVDSTNIDASIRLADALALKQQGSLMGEPVQILQTALETNPNHPQGLWLFGMALNEARNYNEAIVVWQRLLPLLSDDPNSAREVEQLIAGAQQRMSELETTPQNTAAVQAEQSQSKQEAAGELQITVDVKAGMATDIPEGTPVFIYAKAASGPPMPLAVVRHTLNELPLTVTLTDDQAMMEDLKLSAFDEVIVGARISLSGDPIARAGDLFIESDSIDTSTQKSPVSLTIADIVPE